MALYDDMIGKNIFLGNCDKIIGCFYKHTIKYRDLYNSGMGDSYLCEICGFAVPNRGRVKMDATINRYKPEGQPQQFLLQLVSNFDRFFIISAKNKDYLVLYG